MAAEFQIRADHSSARVDADLMSTTARPIEGLYLNALSIQVLADWIF
jgi:hypothetical protein